jgi:hypothetical protein
VLKPIAGAVGGLAKRAAEDVGQWFIAGYNEAVSVALLREADRRIDGKLINPVTGEINVAELEKPGALAFVTDSEFWSKIDPEHRDALRFAQDKIQIEVLKKSAVDIRITKEVAQANGVVLRETHRAVVATKIT